MIKTNVLRNESIVVIKFVKPLGLVEKKTHQVSQVQSWKRISTRLKFGSVFENRLAEEGVGVSVWQWCVCVCACVCKDETRVIRVSS